MELGARFMARASFLAMLAHPIMPNRIFGFSDINFGSDSDSGLTSLLFRPLWCRGE